MTIPGRLNPVGADSDRHRGAALITGLRAVLRSAAQRVRENHAHASAAHSPEFTNRLLLWILHK